MGFGVPFIRLLITWKCWNWHRPFRPLPVKTKLLIIPCMQQFILPPPLNPSNYILSKARVAYFKSFLMSFSSDCTEMFNDKYKFIHFALFDIHWIIFIFYFIYLHFIFNFFFLFFLPFVKFCISNTNVNYNIFYSALEIILRGLHKISRTLSKIKGWKILGLNMQKKKKKHKKFWVLSIKLKIFF